MQITKIEAQIALAKIALAAKVLDTLAVPPSGLKLVFDSPFSHKDEVNAVLVVLKNITSSTELEINGEWGTVADWLYTQLYAAAGLIDDYQGKPN